jgi:hypothetical protein
MPNRTRLIAGGAAAAVVVAGIGYGIYRSQSGGGGHASHAATGMQPSAPASGPEAGATSTLPATAGLKPAITGLIDPFGYPPAPLVSSRTISAFVAMANWRDLQPQPGGPLVHPNAIDQAIAQARASGTGLAVKIRFFAGIHSPAWVLNLDGAPVPIATAGATSQQLAPRFWTSSYQQAYADIQAKLAAAYDAVPEVREVTISACMTIFAEPFIRQMESAATRRGLLDAGYSDSANRACLRNSIDTHHLVWKHTRSSLAFNPYQEINADGSARTDESVTDSFMDYCRQQLGLGCVLENNSVRAPITRLSPAYGRMYAHMRQLGSPITLQTATPDRIGCLLTTECPAGTEGVLDWATSEGATALELPSDLARYAAAFLQPFDARLSANLRA